MKISDIVDTSKFNTRIRTILQEKNLNFNLDRSECKINHDLLPINSI